MISVGADFAALISSDWNSTIQIFIAWILVARIVAVGIEVAVILRTSLTVVAAASLFAAVFLM